ncbi:Hsp70 family protein [Actinomycetospora sp.]|jgi:actin-like ATPase involved in cell morphogenesis|uniref:Hsp70 family protein n=1 Tax=Actinomycetospora sp. TaxID=1872135 RepID=UPI002F41FF9D
MTFVLGVDLGTTFTAAAVGRGDQTEMVPLGDRSAAIPSVVMIREDGTSVVGDAAHRRAAAQPARVAREVKRRLGDPTPLILGGEPHSAAQILSRLLRAAVDAAVERENRRPDGIVLTYPANWGPYKRELFESVPRLADLTKVSMVTEPEAAAAHYASTARVPQGSVVAVYDLGGGTFDATVLRQLEDGFEFLGPPEGIEGLGGIDFDEAVFAHVDRNLDGALSALDLDDPKAAASLVRVRQDCVLAKEALSGDTETSVPVMLPDRHTEVRLTRGEFEEMIRAPIEATVSALRRALTAADIAPEDLSNVLLVGGSSRIPLVSQMLSAELGRPTAVDTHPKHAVALGAAMLAGRRRPAAPRPGTPVRGVPVAPPSGRPADRRRGAAGPASTPPAEARPPGRGPRKPAVDATALANGATVVAKPQGAPTPVRATGSSGRLPVAGPPAGGPRGMRPPPGSVPITPPPSTPFRAGPPPGGPTPPNGGDRRAPGREENPPGSAAGTAPPALGSSSAEAAETRRRRIRMGVLCGVLALVLAGGGVATAAVLTSRSGGATLPPPAPAAVPTTTATPQGAAPIAHVPAADGGSEPTSVHHKSPPTTTTSRKSDSGSGSDGGSGSSYGQ